jgi:glycosyltransferase involved in cell wall biosynthesis
MKIAYVGMKFPQRSEAFICNEVEELERLGYNIHVYSLLPVGTRDRDLLNQFSIKRSIIHNQDANQLIKNLLLIISSPFVTLRMIHWLFVMESRSGLKNLAKLILLLPAALGISYSLKKEKIEIMHLFWGHYPSMLFKIKELLKIKIKLSLFIGAYDLQKNLAITRYAVDIADVCFTHSFSNINFLERHGYDVSKISVFYRGIPAQKVIGARNILHNGKKVGSWMSAGRLIPEKGFRRLLHIFPELYESGVATKLSIAGEGVDRDSLKSFVERLALDDVVHFLGHLEQAELYKIMSKQEFFILLSNKKGEILPNVLKEAMLAGCICVSSRTDGIHELIIDGESGFIFDGSDLSSLINKIKSLSFEEKNKIRSNACEHILANFDVSATIKKYIESWRDCL